MNPLEAARTVAEAARETAAREKGWIEILAAEAVATAFEQFAVELDKPEEHVTANQAECGCRTCRTGETATSLKSYASGGTHTTRSEMLRSYEAQRASATTTKHHNHNHERLVRPEAVHAGLAAYEARTLGAAWVDVGPYLVRKIIEAALPQIVQEVREDIAGWVLFRMRGLPDAQAAAEVIRTYDAQAADEVIRTYEDRRKIN